MNGVRLFAMLPCVIPTNPQCTGMPMVQVVRPFTVSGPMRRVTTAVPTTSPRFDHTRT